MRALLGPQGPALGTSSAQQRPVPRHGCTEARAALLTIAAAIATLPVPARAYSIKTTDAGANVRWRRPVLTLEVASVEGGTLSRRDVAQALSAAAAAWDAVPGVPRIEVVEGDRAAWGIDGVNGVHVLSHWPFPDRRLAVTVSAHEQTTGELIDADILVNGEMAFALLEDERAGEPRYDIELVLTHELGHVLGLGESAVPDATMWPTIRPGELERRELAADDVDGISTLYATPDAPLPAGCSIGRSGRTGGLGAVVVLLACITARRRRDA